MSKVGKKVIEALAFLFCHAWEKPFILWDKSQVGGAGRAHHETGHFY
jgi:hypothetical protein